jgi:hypothetical protein
MADPTQARAREADEVTAPFVLAYCAAVVAALAAFLGWVFWFRGNP